MKVKKFSKKLSINKATIANLSEANQDKARGGAGLVDVSGISCLSLCTCPVSLCPKTNCGDSVNTPCYC
jgi:hypothetical protein